MPRTFQVEDGEVGKKLVLTGHWNSSVADFMLSQNVRSLELNYAKGWSDGPVSFLSDVPWLEGLDLVSEWHLDIAVVCSLVHLRYLNINQAWSGHMDFASLQKLEHCFLECGKGTETILKCANLRYLHLLSYKPRVGDDFGELRTLEVLKLNNSALVSLPRLKSRGIRTLWLDLCPRFNELGSICQCATLSELHLSACKKISKIDELVCLTHLRKLGLSDNGEIASLKPLEQLTTLERVTFCGSTRIADGDLSPLFKLPRLKEVLFDPRRHYSHRPEDFDAAFAKGN
jgi:Leucine-rich repeat (LRR) protein